MSADTLNAIGQLSGGVVVLALVAFQVLRPDKAPVPGAVDDAVDDATMGLIKQIPVMQARLDRQEAAMRAQTQALIQHAGWDFLAVEQIRKLDPQSTLPNPPPLFAAVQPPTEES